MQITKRMPDTKTLLSGVASVAASAMLIRTISNDFFPNEIRNYFASSIHNIYRQFSSQLTIVIEELQGLQTNQVFEAAHCYLGTKMTPSVQRIKVTKAEEEKKLLVHADRGEEILDTFEDFDVKWTLVCTQIEVRNFSHRRVSNASMQSEKRSYELTFNKKNKEKVLNSYLPFIIEKSKAIKEETKIVKFHTIEHRNWQSNAINLDHPMTFNTLAMDSTLKKELIDDLNHFIQSKDFYKRVGKAWKRGYLLYGPPGTGKSSLIAAMANHLNFDIYDLDLTNVHFNNELRPLLLSMKNRSILVVEDIDCSIKLQNRELGEEEPANGKNEVTLSGLLNIIDGLLSCCGEQRIIVFTTNRKEKLDPALLRPGRMDMHIHMSYCRISAFKQLALNYLGIHEHQNFERIQQLLEKVEVTPAEVAGELMKSNDVQVSLQGLVQFLVNKEKILTL